MGPCFSIRARSSASSGVAKPLTRKLAHDLGHHLASLGRVDRDLSARLAQRLHLGLRRALRPRDDRAGVPHFLAWRRGHARDIRHHWLRHVRTDERGRLFLLGAANLADQHDRACIWIGFEALQAVDKRGARYRVAANSDAGGHADALLGELVQRLIRERAGATNDAHGTTRCRDLARGDADVALARRDDAWTVWTEQPHLRVVHLESVEEARFVLSWHALRDDGDEGDARLGRLHDRAFDARRRYEDARRGGAGR